MTGWTDPRRQRGDSHDVARPARLITVAPRIVSSDTGRLPDFVMAVFDGEETARVAFDDGTIGHAEIRVADTVLLAFTAGPDWPETPSMVRVFVTDADATMERAVAAGDTGGDRAAHPCVRPACRPLLRDPLGNSWWIAPVWRTSPGPEMRRLGETTGADATGTGPGPHPLTRRPGGRRGGRAGRRHLRCRGTTRPEEDDG